MLAVGRPRRCTPKDRFCGPYAIAIVISVIVGSGIFVSTGVAAQNHAGAGVFLCFVTACCPCLFTAFCYAEFSAAIPLSGSAYSFTYVSSGELAAYMVGWNLIAEYTISAATVGRAWSGVRRRHFLRFADLLASIN